jgi:hypothetical protein
MLKKKMILLSLCSCLILTLVGCQEKTSFNPVYSVGEVDTYKVVQETVKEVSFEQPSLNKSKLDTTQSTIEMTFDQEAVSVDPDSSAVFDITVKAVKLYSKGQKGVNIDFDSTREADKNNALNKLIGKSYRIRISADGEASAVETGAVKAAATSREGKALVSNEAIEQRHSIVAMPKDETAVIAKNQTWTTLGSTPKGALQPKAFEKVYKVESIKDTEKGKVANVRMEAVETNKKVEGFDAGGGGLGVMANIFDSTADYTGELQYNTTTGELVGYSETLVSEHIAAEEPKGGDSSKGPDVLTMRFISKYSIESAN